MFEACLASGRKDFEARLANLEAQAQEQRCEWQRQLEAERAEKAEWESAAREWQEGNTQLSSMQLLAEKEIEKLKNEVDAERREKEKVAKECQASKEEALQNAHEA